MSDESAAAAGRGARVRAYLGRALRGAVPCLLAGASLGVTAAELWVPGRYERLGTALAGALYALVVRTLVRTFPLPPSARPLAGLVVGPLPFALAFARTLPRDERLALGLALAVLGALVGALDAFPVRGRSGH